MVRLGESVTRRERMASLMSGRRAGALALLCLGHALFACSESKPSGGDMQPPSRALAKPESEREKVPEKSVSASPHTRFAVRGVVVDREGSPVSQAMVMQGGRSEAHVLTDPKGGFHLTLEDNGRGIPTLVAAKVGYRAVGEHLLQAPEEPITLRMHALRGPDNLAYVYKDPGDGENTDLEDCTHCHQSFTQQFLSSKHAQATKNPFVQDLYAGVNRALGTKVSCEEAGGQWREGLSPGSSGRIIEKCYLREGVLTELNPQCGENPQGACDDPRRGEELRPTRFGACADCHAPGIDGVAGGRDLHEAVGTAYDKGVHCDVCHKVADIDLDKAPGVGQRLVMGRPSEPGINSFTWEPVYYGPLMDVPNPVMHGSYQPKFKSAEFCAGCHEQNQQALIPGQTLDARLWPDGLPIHSTFSEWKSGPYPDREMPCQSCHMPPSVDALNSVPLLTDVRDESIIFGWERSGEDNRMHTFLGPLVGEPRLLDQALKVRVETEVKEGALSVRVSLENVGAGHAVPTGEPMRALVLVVEAESPACASLRPSGGMSVDDIGGALAQGLVGEQLTLVGDRVTWRSAATKVKVGHVLRALRPTGAFIDYEGVGTFAGSKRRPEDKGLPEYLAIGVREVVALDGPSFRLKEAFSLKPGDLVYLGEPWTGAPEDASPSRHLAGLAGQTFARVLVDHRGERQVPHYRALDMVRDNRIPAGGSAISEYTFARSEACTEGHVKVTLLYRPHPLSLARRYGWEAKDYVMARRVVAW